MIRRNWRTYAEPDAVTAAGMCFAGCIVLTTVALTLYGAYLVGRMLIGGAP